MDPAKLIPPQQSSYHPGDPGAFTLPFHLAEETTHGYAGTYNDGANVGYGGGDQAGITGAIYAPGSGGNGGFSGSSMSMLASKTSADLVQPTSTAFTSTPGQDQQVCPLIKLPDYMVLQEVSSNSQGSKGSWVTSNRVTLAGWQQNFWGTNWNAIYLKTVDGQLAYKAVPTTEQELNDKYLWRAASATYPNLTELDARQQLVGASSNAYTFVLTDCQDTLMFVVRLQKGLPGVMDIYDRSGGLQAHTVSDPKILRHQFVDTSGYLIAIAESPGILMNVTRPLGPIPTDKSHISPYAVLYTAGTFSGLMNQEFHWVIASAVQVRAMVDAYGTWTPNLTVGIVGMAATAFFLVIFCLIGAMLVLYRMVFPELAELRNYKNPFIFLPGHLPVKGSGLQYT